MTRKESVFSEFTDRFGKEPEVVVRAPGRVDLMGSHTDYNLGFVMTMAVNRDTWFAAASNGTGKVRIHSINMKETGEFDIGNGDEDNDDNGSENGENALEDLAPDAENDSAADWIRYPWGVAEELKDEGYEIKGCDAVVHTTIPLGGGLSSSAALEAAALLCFREMAAWDMNRVDMARICQRAENRFAGVNCGILDQYSSFFGRKGSAMVLDCRSLTHTEVSLPSSISVVVCNTNSSRELSGSEYGTRREQCEEAVSILSKRDDRITSLRDVSSEIFHKHARELPEELYKRSRFIVEENERVQKLAAAFRTDMNALITQLFIHSYDGAKYLYEIITPEMDAMREAAAGSPGLIGIRQAGAGFGGCLVALVDKGKEEQFCSSVFAHYEKKTGISGSFYTVEPAEGAGKLEQ